MTQSQDLRGIFRPVIFSFLVPATWMPGIGTKKHIHPKGKYPHGKKSIYTARSRNFLPSIRFNRIFVDDPSITFCRSTVPVCDRRSGCSSNCDGWVKKLRTHRYKATKNSEWEVDDGELFHPSNGWLNGEIWDSPAVSNELQSHHENVAKCHRSKPGPEKPVIDSMLCYIAYLAI